MIYTFGTAIAVLHLANTDSFWESLFLKLLLPTSCTNHIHVETSSSAPRITFESNFSTCGRSTMFFACLFLQMSYPSIQTRLRHKRRFVYVFFYMIIYCAILSTQFIHWTHKEFYVDHTLPTNKVLHWYLLGTHVEHTRLFWNRPLAMRFRTLKAEAMKHVQCKYWLWNFVGERLGKHE